MTLGCLFRVGRGLPYVRGSVEGCRGYRLGVGCAHEEVFEMCGGRELWWRLLVFSAGCVKLTVVVNFWLIFGAVWVNLGRNWVATKFVPNSYQVRTKVVAEVFLEVLTNLLK